MSVLRYSIPNSLTALSLLLGLSSIVTAQIGDLEFAAWLIVWCGLLDTMDGIAARLLKATSSFGAEFDSMADLVSFGVAPGVLIFNAGLQIADVEVESGQFWVLLAACGVFVLAGAMRLARFNLASSKPRTGWFAGIPITAAGGGLLSSMVIVLLRHDDIAVLLPLHLYLPVLMFVLALLMISRLRFPKAVLRESNIINAFQVINIAAIFVCGIFRIYPEYLFGIGVFLLIAGIIAGRITRDA
ncbi:MAG: CDP-alcohol phosphatidyltransferase family protein [Gammaproteobacteria bacterium]|nr:CDP-alcohol phosphatidyltransferase family protein [Gammaproteobacteria bacterium]MDH3415436.1 CDP-alcohol phosphatidyltransferase family protein [Gammaproteobacteria bacterium]